MTFSLLNKLHYETHNQPACCLTFRWWLACALVIFSTLVGLAQEQQQDSTLALVVNTYKQRHVVLGASAWQYSGSYGSSGQPLQAGFFLGFRTNKARYLNTRFELGYGSIAGNNLAFALNDPNVQGPAPSFQTSMLYAQAELNLNLVKTEQWQLYLSAGFGILNFTPRDGSGLPLATVNASRALGELYGTTTTWLPVGIGGMYWVPNGPGIGLQVTLQNPTTAYLDNADRLAPGNDQVISSKLSVFLPLPDAAPKAKKLVSATPRKRSR